MKKRYSIPLILIGLMIILNITARLSRPFADFYVTRIFPYISDCISFISGLLPFSLGEMLAYRCFCCCSYSQRANAGK